MTPRPRIFISAVTKELASARQLVANTLHFLGYEAVWQDVFGTEHGDLRDMLRRKVDSCEGLIQLVGRRFGFSPTNPETDPDAISYTQFELLHARGTGRKVWPILLADDFPADAFPDEPAAHSELQKKYRERLQAGGDLYQSATDHGALEGLILKLRQPLDELRDEWRKEQRHARRFRVTAGAALLILVLFAGTGLQLGWWTKKDTTQIRKDVATIKDDTAQKKLLIADYVGLRVAAFAAGDKDDDPIRQRLIFAELEKKHQLPAGTLDRELPETARKLAADVTASAAERAEGAYAARDFAEAERLALQAADEARKALPLVRSNIVYSLELAGWSASARRDDPKALAHFTAAAALTEKTRHPLEWAAIHHALAYTLVNQGDFAQAEALIRQVIPIQTEKLGAEHSHTLASRNNLAEALAGRARYKDAEAEHRARIQIEQRVYGPEDRRTLRSRMNLAEAMSKLGRYAEAEAEHRATFEILQRVHGPEHPATLACRHNFAKALHNLARYPEADAEYRAIIRIRQRVLGPENPDTLRTRHNLANNLASQGQVPEAVAEHRLLLPLIERVRGPEHPDTLASRISLATALATQGNYAEAETHYRVVLKQMERAHGPDHPITLTALFNLANCMARDDKDEEALPFARRAVEGARQQLPAAHPHRKAYEQLYEVLSAKK